MQSWLPAQGSGTVALRALPIVLAITLAQPALSFDSSLVVLPDEPASTLDGRLTPQNLDLQETVLDFVGSGVLGESKGPRFVAPKQVKDAPISDAAKTQASGKARKPSPFRKWVKPQASADDQVEKPTADEPAVPEVARATRPRRLESPTTPTPAEALPELEMPSEEESFSEAKPLNSAGDAPLETAPENDAVEDESATRQPPASAFAPPFRAKQDLPPLTRSQQNLRKKIRSVLTHYYNRPLNTRDRSPWEIMHAMLAYEAHSKVLQGGPDGDPITAVGWLCYNQSCKRRTLMYVSDEGELKVRVGPALQGHRGQLMAMLAQSRINTNYPMLVEGHELKVADLIEMEKRTCYPRTELTFKLIGLMHYLHSDETWLNDQGMEWSIPKLISEEIRQPVRGAACGGTHRLAGLTMAYKTRERRGEPIDGEYLRAKKFVTRYQQYAYRLQNRDGSFSTEWFRGPGNEEDLDRKLKTTGHLLEWLLYASTDQELYHWRTTKAVNYLANIMARNRYKDWEAGPLGHAIHALLVYDRLVFSPYDAGDEGPIAQLNESSGRRR